MSHFSAIGFTVTPEELQELTEQASREGTRVDSPHGGYFHWSPGAGVELWAQANKQEEIVGCNPHFAGAGRLPASIIETLNVPGCPLDGRCFGWAAPRDEKNPYSGLHALSADLPDFDFVEARILIPPIVTLQVAAFAEELECFPTETNFLESEAARQHGAAAGQWIWQQQEIEEEPQSKVFLNGIVKQSEQRENPITGSPFIALLLRTEAGTIDVVVDPEIVPRRPVVGMVAAGTFWLSARVVSDLPPANENPPLLPADSLP